MVNTVLKESKKTHQYFQIYIKKILGSCLICMAFLFCTVSHTFQISHSFGLNSNLFNFLQGKDSAVLYTAICYRLLINGVIVYTLQYISECRKNVLCHNFGSSKNSEFFCLCSQGFPQNIQCMYQNAKCLQVTVQLRVYSIFICLNVRMVRSLAAKRLGAYLLSCLLPNCTICRLLPAACSLVQVSNCRLFLCSGVYKC